MKILPLIVCALACASVAQARPQVLEESGTITRPDSSWTYFGRFVAVDGNWALVQGDRFVPDPDAELGTRHDGAALLYEKVGSAWVYRGVLGAIEAIDEWTKPGFAMKDGVAMVIQNSARIFERTGSTWTQAAANIPPVQGADIEIANGKIVVPRIYCSWEAVVLAKTAGVWNVEDSLPGDDNTCGDNPPTPPLDVDSRVAIFNQSGESVIKLFAPGTSGGVPRWNEVAEIARPESAADVFGPDVAIRGGIVATVGSREAGTLLFQEIGSEWGLVNDRMDPIDGALQPTEYSATSLAHNSQYFFQRNFSYDRGVYVVNIFTLNLPNPVYQSGTLVAKRGGSLGSDLDISGTRVIVGGRVNFGGDNTVRVFDLPPELNFRGLLTDDFEQPTAGGFFDWQQTPGSAFAVVDAGPVGSNSRVNHVFRQSSTAGDAGAFLAQSDHRDQAVEAEITPIAFNGADRWVGLMARRVDAANYYYVTARSSGSVQLRKKVNGTFTTLASVPYPVAAGRKIRLRIETIGVALRVYIDSKLHITVYDSSIPRGVSGLIMYRASADYDNVMVGEAPHTSIFVSDFTTPNFSSWRRAGGTWQQSGGVYRQTDLAAGNAQTFIGTPSDEHVVQARVRVTAFGGGDPWVGLIARYIDPQNYFYVTLRKSGEVRLRYLVDGDGPYEIGRMQIPVTPGTWYTLRCEHVFGQFRVYVDGKLVIQGTQGLLPPALKGKVGLMTYRTAAEFDDFVSYQP
jgi:hypothetical protein